MKVGTDRKQQEWLVLLFAFLYRALFSLCLSRLSSSLRFHTKLSSVKSEANPLEIIATPHRWSGNTERKGELFSLVFQRESKWSGILFMPLWFEWAGRHTRVELEIQSIYDNSGRCRGWDAAEVRLDGIGWSKGWISLITAWKLRSMQQEQWMVQRWNVFGWVWRARPQDDLRWCVFLLFQVFPYYSSFISYFLLSHIFLFFWGESNTDGVS